MAQGRLDQRRPGMAARGVSREGPKRKEQTLLGILSGERGKKVEPHKGRKCPGNQVYNQKLKKCVAQSGPAHEAYRAQRERRTGEKTTVRRLMKGVHGTQQ